MSLATLAGAAVSKARVQIPAYGVTWADVDLVEDAKLSGAVVLQIADVSIACTVVSGGAVNGRAAYRVAAGGGGWGKEIAARAYADDMGIKVASIAGDAAAAVGERVEGFPTTRLGPHFARALLPASWVLHEVAPRNWRVDFDGVTRFGLRAPSTYTGDGVRTYEHRAIGVIDLATESLAGLVPGVSVDGMPGASDVEYELDEKRLTARVYYGPKRNRRIEALAKIFDALDPRRRYRCSYEYRVVSQAGERLNLQVVRVASGLSDLARVPVRPGMAGLRATVKLGELVLVDFIEGDPSRPCVRSHDAPDAPGWEPQLLEIGGKTGDWIAQAGKVATEINRLWTWNEQHVHPTGVGPSGPSSTTHTSPASTACAKVKVK
jgi:hypothetical protein